MITMGLNLYLNLILNLDVNLTCLAMFFYYKLHNKYMFNDKNIISNYNDNDNYMFNDT